MTSISFGGGPTVEQRRDFAGLKDGSQVPGYRGYIPQIKYRVGKTYGNDTLELSTDYEQRHPVHKAGPPIGLAKDPLKNQLPGSTGDNKYTEKMVPGYRGYIPRMPFKFGDTYKIDCDYCIDDHLTNVNKYRNKERDLMMSARSFPTLQAVDHDPKVRDHLNTYRDTHPSRPTLIEDRRAPTEPPIPGYQGYVPRIGTTELGLGCRYNKTTKQGFETFWNETDYHKNAKSAPISLNRTPGSGTGVPVGPGNVMYSKRLYLRDGMIPKYTGYVPQRRYNFGNTYGDTTRSLEVCAHENTSFGEHIKTKPQGTIFSSVC